MTDVMSCDMAEGGDLERASSNIRTNSLDDPWLAVGSFGWQQLEKDRGDFKALVPVECWFGLVNLHCFTNLAGMIVRFACQHTNRLATGCDQNSQSCELSHPEDGGVKPPKRRHSVD